MSYLECNCKWHFAKQPLASQDIGPNNAAIEHFSATPYPSLIRESIQNSLDVVLDKNQPVRMQFKFGQLKAKTYTGFYKLREHINGALKLYGDKAEKEYRPMLEQFEQTYNFQDALFFIKVSDFNTQGMDYVPNNSPFHAFIRAIGLTVKNEESSGGSFGFGKSAYFLMSPIHTVLVSTMTKEGKFFFEGAAQLCTHLFKDEDGNEVKYQHYGYYDNQEGHQPASLPTDIPNKFRREEVGTDIFIMGVDGSTEKQQAAYKEMIEATLRHFWLAILHKKLIVEIGETRIDDQSLNDLMLAHFPSFIDKSRVGDDYNPRPYYEAVKNAELSSSFVHLKNRLPILGDVNLFVWKNKEARDSVIYMRKQRMFINRNRFYSSYGYSAVFLCTDTHGNKLLKSIEDPSHKKWEPRRNPSKGHAIFDEINDFVSSSIQDMFVSDTGGPLTVTGLEDYLFVPEELVATDRDDIEDNPFFGSPADEVQDEGTLPISTIEPPTPKFAPDRKEAVGKVVTVTPSMSGRQELGGDLGGHQRSTSKRKKRGKGSSPDRTAFTHDENEQDGEFLENIPVRYRVIAEHKDGRMIHSIIIKSDFDVERGQIEIIVGGEEKDEALDIISSSQGTIDGNIISNIKLLRDRRNIIELQFADKMKHTIKLTAYEFK
jgi:hypothetical protein